MYLVARALAFLWPPRTPWPRGMDRSLHCHLCGIIALVQDGHQKGVGVLYHQPARLHDAGLGVGGYTAGVFHLVTHAFFKALLFLASGSVIHGVDTQDMKEMGGLCKKMPVTFWTWLVGSAALAGI